MNTPRNEDNFERELDSYIHSIGIAIKIRYHTLDAEPARTTEQIQGHEELINTRCENLKRFLLSRRATERTALIEEIEKKDKYINAHVQFVTDVLDGVKLETAHRELLSHLESGNEEN